jgi:uncharacterized protein YbaP (TraB family)
MSRENGSASSSAGETSIWTIFRGRVRRRDMPEKKCLRRLAAVIFALAASSLFGQVQTEEQAVRGFFWRVDSEKNTVYILGSLHFADASVYPLSRSINESFEASHTLVVEADVASSGGQEVRILTQSLGLYLDGTTLESHLPEPLYERVQATAEEIGLDPLIMNLMKPWMLAVTIASLRLLEIGIQPEYGIDLHFLQRARGRKEIAELESAAFQIELIANFSDETQVLFLEQSLEEAETIEKDMSALIEHWKRGDTESFGELFHEPYEDPTLDPIYVELVVKRNLSFADKIEAYLDGEAPYFVIFGAGHLVGRSSVAVLLKERGYRVTQL